MIRIWKAGDKVKVAIGKKATYDVIAICNGFETYLGTFERPPEFLKR